MQRRFEPEDIKLLRQGASLSDIKLHDHLKSIDPTVASAVKLWNQIQESLRYPWRQK